MVLSRRTFHALGGLIAPGMAADLLAVRGAPSPDALQDPMRIVKDGVFIR